VTARETFNGVKVFSATMQQDRNVLGDKITEWLARHPQLRVVDTVIRQSSDASFHCLTVILFYFAP